VGHKRSEPAASGNVRARYRSVQLLWKSQFSDEEYVSRRAWEGAIPGECPFHPEGGCGLRRLGSYERVAPQGIRVARWWCPAQRASVSLLPDFLAARLSGTLAEVEAVVVAVEVTRSIAAAVDVVHLAEAEDAIGQEGALRSIRLRVRAVYRALLAAATLLPQRFAGVTPTIAGFREVLGVSSVLGAVRHLAERHLSSLPTPLGFRARVPG
jgi:hypothetical protein